MSQLGDEAKILAGGHSLLPMMKLRFAEPAHLVDLNNIDNLKGICEDNGQIVIGSMTSENALIASSLLQEKCPMLPEGLAATRELADDGIRVNVTLVFQPGQALLAAKAGAAYISPFVGRLDDIGENGMDMVATIVEMLESYDYGAEVLVASVRGPGHVIEAARMGADVATCPFKVLQQLLKHPLTDSGLAAFLADWEKARK